MDFDNFEMLALEFIAARIVKLHAKRSPLDVEERHRILEEEIRRAIMIVYKRGRRDQLEDMRRILDPTPPKRDEY